MKLEWFLLVIFLVSLHYSAQRGIRERGIFPEQTSYLLDGFHVFLDYLLSLFKHPFFTDVRFA